METEQTEAAGAATPAVETAERAPAVTDGMRETPLGDLAPNPDNPRRDGGGEDDRLRELADSLKVHGMIEPIIARPRSLSRHRKDGGARLEIVAGERRWRAARLAGMETVPVLVRTYDDRTALEVALIENLQRKDVHPLDEAAAFVALMEHAKLDAKAIAARIGRTVGYIYNRAMLVKALIPEVVAKLRAGEIEASHAEVISRLPRDAQGAALEACFVHENRMAGVKLQRISVAATVAHLRLWLQENHYRRLKDVPWPLDEKGGPGGACAQCEFNSANQLYNETVQDCCLKPACYQAKRGWYVKRRVAEVSKETGKPAVAIRTDDYTADDGIKGVKPLLSWEYEESRRQDAEAVPAVAVEKPAEVVWVKVRNPAAKVARSQTPTERRLDDKMIAYRQKHLAWETERERAVRVHLLDRMVESALDKVVPNDLLVAIVNGLDCVAWNEDGWQCLRKHLPKLPTFGAAWRKATENKVRPAFAEDWDAKIVSRAFLVALAAEEALSTTLDDPLPVLTGLLARRGVDAAAERAAFEAAWRAPEPKPPVEPKAEAAPAAKGARKRKQKG